MFKAISACYVNKQGPLFPRCLGKKKKNQRAYVLSAAAPAFEEGSQRTRNPGKLDGSQQSLAKLEPGQSQASGRRCSASRSAHGHQWAPRYGRGFCCRGERKAQIKAIHAISHKVAPGLHLRPRRGAGVPAGRAGGGGHPRRGAGTPPLLPPPLRKMLRAWVAVWLCSQGRWLPVH